MNKLLEQIVRHANPLHDFDNIKFYSIMKTRSWEERAELQVKNLAFLPTIVKPIVRGAIIGSALEAIGSYILEDASIRGFGYAAAAGASIDYGQYTTRAAWNYFKVNIRDLFK